MHFKRIAREEKGAALVMVIILFSVMVIMATSVLIMAQNNTKQIVVQTDGMESYYIARSGAEVVYQVLSGSPTALANFKTSNTPVEITIQFDEGDAVVTIQGYNDGTKRRVRVSSVGEFDGTSVPRKTILEFDYEGLGDVSWTR